MEKYILETKNAVSAINAFIRKTYNRFSFYFDSQETYLNIVMNEIENIKNDYDGTNSYVAILKDRINHRVFSYVIKKIYYEDSDKQANLNDSMEIIDQYLKEVYSKPILSINDRNKLLMEAHDGSVSARNKLIESNLRVALNESMKYLNRGFDFLDVVQEANIGLQKGIDNFDITMLDKFLTYIKISIWGNIACFMRKETPSQVPLEDADISSIDENLEFVDMMDSLEYFMENCDLKPTERKIFLSLYGLNGEAPMTHTEVAKKYDFTYSSETTMYNQAMKKIRKRYSDLLDDKEKVEKLDFLRQEKETLRQLRRYLQRPHIKPFEYALNELSIDELKYIKVVLTGHSIKGSKRILKPEIIPKLKQYINEYNEKNKDV